MENSSDALRLFTVIVAGVSVKTGRVVFGNRNLRVLRFF